MSDRQFTENIALTEFRELHLETCTSTFLFIEGYMLKTVEKTNSKEMFHLRWLRIRFSSGKMIIKIDRGDKKMRSFNLKDLIKVEPGMNLIPSNSTSDFHPHDSPDCLTRDQVLEKYELNELSSFNIWQYSLKLDFADRQFVFSCASKVERDAWLRVLKIIVRMNEEKITFTSINPYAFEKEQIQSKMTEKSEVMVLRNDRTRKSRQGLRPTKTVDPDSD